MRERYPGVFTICDGKFGDVGHTSEELARYVFDDLGADAIMVNPYMGSDSIDVFSKRDDKAVIVCVNTSNPTAGEVQELVLEN
ncbi:orotidine 5'-phosphate decarboxylase [Candidatus Peribacteria bacterium]|nr:orotidine 5'-phosphate decarboxylase [Candidatus Peribacteria bacterium]